MSSEYRTIEERVDVREVYQRGVLGGVKRIE
jgi:hypothetical protein